MSVFVGVDGGGTRTRAVVIDAEGRELARAEDEGAVVTAHRPDDAVEAVRRAVGAALEKSGGRRQAEVLWAGLAGAGTAAPRAAVTRALRGLDLAERLIVGTDVEAAFYSAFAGGPGLLVIVGTGSIVWARNEDGAERRVGGWGRTLGDEGSGYWIGLEGLRRLTRSADGRAEPTTMEGPLLQACGIHAVDEAVGWVETATKSQIASLAPHVVACADEGDDAATSVVAEAVEHLEVMVRTAGEVGGDVVLWGGLVAPGGPLRGRVSEAVGSLGLRVVAEEVDPPLGAARLARAARGG
ncbi:MAG: hypothetical protein HKN72_11315 [Gemmatimonadetes bacterium]|nr:hypothetical protein [Gemmatimonadota bacterium]